MGMAVGIFAAFTPTIPFHTILAISLAFVFKASKPAALIGSWFSNPLTIPALYYGSYKVGGILLGHEIPARIEYGEIKKLLMLGWDAAFAMILGGVLLGVIPAVGAYFITFHLVRKIRVLRAADLASASSPDMDRVDNQKTISKSNNGH